MRYDDGSRSAYEDELNEDNTKSLSLAKLDVGPYVSFVMNFILKLITVWSVPLEGKYTIGRC